jgi:hypothetical protein
LKFIHKVRNTKRKTKFDFFHCGVVALFTSVGSGVVVALFTSVGSGGVVALLVNRCHNSPLPTEVKRATTPHFQQK